MESLQRMSYESSPSNRASSGLRWRNATTIAALCALLGVMVLTTPLAVQWVSNQRERQAATPHPIVADANDARAIAAAVLEGLHFESVPSPPPEPGECAEPPRRRTLVIDNQSIGFGSDAKDPSPDSMISEYLVGPMLDEFAPRKFREELIIANRERGPLDLSGIPDLVAVRSADIEKILARDGWSAFYETWPDSAGLVRVSRPVLSADRQQALIFVEFRCAGMCGHGDIYRLERAGMGWRIVELRNVWMS